jgi:hypothetical protein
MPNTATLVQSPNDILASRVTDALVAAGLITDTHKPLLLSKLKTGGVKQEDWNLWIDIATAPAANSEEANNE